MSDKERISFGDWCDMKGIEPTMGQVDAFVREKVRAATPQVTPTDQPMMCDSCKWAMVANCFHCPGCGKEIRLAPEGTSEQAPHELELEQEADGRWLAEFMRFPGVAAYGPSKEEAILNAAKVLIESEAAPSKILASLKEFLALRQACIDVGGTEGPLDQEMITRLAEMQIGVVDRAQAAIAEFEAASEQASPTPEQSRNTGVSLDGGKTIHSKFKND